MEVRGPVLPQFDQPFQILCQQEEVHVLDVRFTQSGELQKFLDNAGQPVRLTDHDPRQHLGIGILAATADDVDLLGTAAQAGEGVADFVGDAGGHLTQVRQVLGPTGVLLQQAHACLVRHQERTTDQGSRPILEPSDAGHQAASIGQLDPFRRRPRFPVQAREQSLDRFGSEDLFQGQTGEFAWRQSQKPYRLIIGIGNGSLLVDRHHAFAELVEKFTGEDPLLTDATSQHLSEQFDQEEGGHFDGQLANDTVEVAHARIGGEVGLGQRGDAGEAQGRRHAENESGQGWEDEGCDAR